MSAIAPGNKGLTREGLPEHLVGLTVEEMRAASPLPRDAQMVIDNAVLRVGLERLTVAADLMAEGLTYSLPNPLSVTEVYWESISKTGGAFRTMSPEARGEYQLPARTPYRIPIYLTMDDFSLNVRTLLMSQRVGAPLDTTLVEDATRRVNEAIEDATINGAGLQVGGFTTPGLLNAPNVNSITYTGSAAWTAMNGQEIVDEVFRMIDALQAVNRFGPYNLYIPTLYGTHIEKNFTDGTATFTTSTRQRLEAIQAGGRNLRIRVADRLPANRTMMVQMTRDVVDIIDGQRPTVVPWTSPSGFTLFWTVMAIMIPRVKTDFEETSGIVIGNI